MKKSNKKKIFKSILIVIIPIIIFCLVLLVISKINRENKKYTTENDEFYQYFAGKRFDYNGVLTLDNNRILSVKLNNKEITSYSSPLYYENNNSFLLPSNMSIVFYEGSIESNLLNYYTVIYQTNNYFMAKYDNKEEVISSAFLYDGFDTYLFLEETNIHIGDKVYELKPMSYVVVIYNGKVEIYNYGSKNGVILENNKQVYAKFKNVSIDLNEDILTNEYNSFILYSTVEDLESFIK